MSDSSEVPCCIIRLPSIADLQIICLIYLSNGELGLNEQAANGKMQRNNGEKVRFIDIPVDCESNMGIFETVPDGLTPSEYAENIKSACRKHYGVAGSEFVEKMLAKGTKYIKKQLKKHMDDFLIYHDISGLNGIEKRIATRFALLYASGVHAVELGILPFTASDIMAGVSYCYRKATGGQQSSKLNILFNDTFKQALKNKAIKLHECKIYTSKLKNEPVLSTQVNGENVLAIDGEFLKLNILHGYDSNMVLNVLENSGVLLSQNNKPKSTRAITYKGESVGRRYCLRESGLFQLLEE